MRYIKCECCGDLIKGRHPYTPNDNIFCNNCSDKYFELRDDVVVDFGGYEKIKSWDAVDLETIKRIKEKRSSEEL